MDLPNLIGTLLKTRSGRPIGIITAAHSDKTGIAFHATVTDPKVRKLLELPSHEEVRQEQHEA